MISLGVIQILRTLKFLRNLKSAKRYPNVVKSAGCEIVDNLMFSSYLQQSSSLRAYDPLPATPSPEIENSHFLTAIETLTLFLMGRITTRCPGEKVQYLYSQVTCIDILSDVTRIHSRD